MERFTPQFLSLLAIYGAVLFGALRTVTTALKLALGFQFQVRMELFVVVLALAVLAYRGPNKTQEALTILSFFLVAPYLGAVAGWLDDSRLRRRLETERNQEKTPPSNS